MENCGGGCPRVLGKLVKVGCGGMGDRGGFEKFDDETAVGGGLGIDFLIVGNLTDEGDVDEIWRDTADYGAAEERAWWRGGGRSGSRHRLADHWCDVKEDRVLIVRAHDFE